MAYLDGGWGKCGVLGLWVRRIWGGRMVGGGDLM